VAPLVADLFGPDSGQAISDRRRRAQEAGAALSISVLKQRILSVPRSLTIVLIVDSGTLVASSTFAIPTMTLHRPTRIVRGDRLRWVEKSGLGPTASRLGAVVEPGDRQAGELFVPAPITRAGEW
jgi:hypothetical protein